MNLTNCLILLLVACQAHAAVRAVFAHFMVYTLLNHLHPLPQIQVTRVAVGGLKL
jgi:hypothetical protein